MKFNPLLSPVSEKPTDAVNLAGGSAYGLDAKTRLALLAICSHLKDEFYKTGDEQLKELEDLCKECDPLYIAKLAVYTRRFIGNRSTSYVLTGQVFMNSKAKGQKWLRQFARAAVRRPDDMGEILGYLKAKGMKKLPNALKAGFAKSLERMDGHRLAKYRGVGKEFNLYDIVNLCHPKSTPALTELMRGSLASPVTWEVVISAAGSNPQKKAAAWSSLLHEKGLGYLALLRNVRNICDSLSDSEGAMEKLCEQLRNVDTSVVFPHQFLPFLGEDFTHLPEKVRDAIESALDVAMSAIPTIPGKTLIAIDASGSMFNTPGKGAMPMHKAALFGAALSRKSADAVVVLFDVKTQAYRVSGAKSLLKATEALIARGMNDFKGGTDFACIFAGLGSYMDNIIILSDMQGWGDERLALGFANYRRATHTNPNVLCFDTNGYGTLKFPQEKVYLLGGVSEKVFNIAATLFSDKQALIQSIENSDFTNIA